MFKLPVAAAATVLLATVHAITTAKTPVIRIFISDSRIGSENKAYATDFSLYNKKARGNQIVGACGHLNATVSRTN
jgi:hypothetical protein